MTLKVYFLTLIILLCSACSAQKPLNTQLAFDPNELVLKHLLYLSSDRLQGRKIGTMGGKLSQDYIVNQLTKSNVKPLGAQYLAPFTITGLFKATQGKNVVGFIEGTEFPDKFIVISAHFDHIGGRGNSIYNGADDNASGTSALLFYANKLQQAPLRYSVILLFTDGEEVNLNGAKAFIAQNTTLLANIVLNINLDMIAGDATTKSLRYISRGLTELLGEQQALALQQQGYAVRLKKGFRQHSVGGNKKVKWQVASDHGVFYRHKIPFIYYGVGCHKNYHQTSDTYENINSAFFIAAVDNIYHQILFIDQNL